MANEKAILISKKPERNARNEPEWGALLPVRITRADNSLGFSEVAGKIKTDDGREVAEVSRYLSGVDFIIQIGKHRYTFQLKDAILQFIEHEPKLRKAKKGK